MPACYLVLAITTDSLSSRPVTFAKKIVEPTFDAVVSLYFISRVVTQFSSHFKLELPLRALTLITHSHSALARRGTLGGTTRARTSGRADARLNGPVKAVSRSSAKEKDGLHRLRSTHANQRFSRYRGPVAFDQGAQKEPPRAPPPEQTMRPVIFKSSDPRRRAAPAYAPVPVLTPPPVPMLAQLAPRLPRGKAWLYEPKLDGFRGLLWRRTASAVQLLSRNSRDLGPWFPELIRAGQKLPVGTLIDGEIVIADDEACVDFAALQVRLSSARKQVPHAAFERAAVLVVFDALEIDGLPLVDEPLAVRREHLERLLEALHPCLQLIDQTADVDLAEDWLKLLPSIEGVVAKRADRRYASGRVRDWVKVKRYRTIDCIVIGLAGDLDAPKLVLGLRHPDNLAHHLGVSRVLHAAALEPLAPLLHRLGPEEPAIRSRWQHDAVPPWRRLPPKLVCEIEATTFDGGRWLRQPATFIRWRPDLTPEDCLLDQLRQ